MNYSTDRPIEMVEQDLLGRSSFSNQLGKAIYEYNGKDGLVIGLFGKWGTGKTFEKFWCLFDGEMIIGTVAVRRIGDKESELKALYLLEKYHGKGLGRLLLETALIYVAEKGYRTIFLDTISSSKKAVRLYKKVGFMTTDRYNNNENADVFMKLTI